MWLFDNLFLDKNTPMAINTANVNLRDDEGPWAGQQGMIATQTISVPLNASVEVETPGPTASTPTAESFQLSPAALGVPSSIEILGSSSPEATSAPGNTGIPDANEAALAWVSFDIGGFDIGGIDAIGTDTLGMPGTGDTQTWGASTLSSGWISSSNPWSVEILSMTENTGAGNGSTPGIPPDLSTTTPITEEAPRSSEITQIETDPLAGTESHTTNILWSLPEANITGGLLDLGSPDTTSRTLTSEALSGDTSSTTSAAPLSETSSIDVSNNPLFSLFGEEESKTETPQAASVPLITEVQPEENLLTKTASTDTLGIATMFGDEASLETTRTLSAQNKETTEMPESAHTHPTVTERKKERNHTEPKHVTHSHHTMHRKDHTHSNEPSSLMTKFHAFIDDLKRLEIEDEAEKAAKLEQIAYHEDRIKELHDEYTSRIRAHRNEISLINHEIANIGKERARIEAIISDIEQKIG